ncbi:cysteine desulfurase [bacterium]|nr:cysteine desulfurase [bacterium]
MRRVYLDHNATTPMRKEVIDEMLPYFDRIYANPETLHSFGQEAAEALSAARRKVAKLINCASNEVYFTSGGSEANNMFIKGVAFRRLDKKGHIITSAIEHSAVLSVVRFLVDEFGFEATYIEPDRNGIISPTEFEKAIKHDSFIASIMYVNNEVGTIQPIEEMAKIAHEHNILFHSDTVQAFGKLPVDVGKLGVDAASASAHKFYGPKGVGFLYLRNGTRITPLIHGGGHERSRRAGTHNVPGIVGLAKALELGYAELEDEEKRLRRLSNLLVDKITDRIPDVYLNGDREKAVANTVSLSFRGVEGESVLLALDMKGIAVTTGSACASKSLKISHVLKAMKTEPILAAGTIRFSLGHQTTEDDINYTVDALAEIIPRLRKISAL